MYFFAFFEVGEDAQAGVGRGVGFDVFVVEFHQFIAFLDVLAVFDKDFEALAFELDRIDADVQEVFYAVGCGHAHGMFCVEDEGDRPVFRCIDRAVGRGDEEAVAGHLAGKSFVRGFRNGMEAAREGRIEVVFFCGCFRFSWRFRSVRGFSCWRRFCSRGGFDGAVCRVGCQIAFQVGFDDGDLRAIDDLDTLAFLDDADSTGRFQGGIVD